MKKTLNWMLKSITLTAAVIGMYSCEQEEPKQPEQPDPVFNLATDLVEVPQEGGAAEITYSIENAVQGIGVKAECEDSWVHDFDCRQKDVISFTVDPNEAEETRETTVTVTYGEKSESFTVRQAEYIAPAPFNITIDDLTETSVTTTVVPLDEEIQYVCSAVTKSFYDENYGSPEKYAEGLMKIFEDEARNRHFTLYDLMIRGNYLRSKEQTYKYGSRRPDTEHYVGVFGVTIDQATDKWTLTTEAVLEPFKTKTPERSDISFELEYKINGPIADMTVTPSDNSQIYYFDAISEKELTELGLTIEEVAQNLLLNYMSQGAMMGMPPEMVMEQVGSYGKTTKSLELNANTKYIGFAYAMTMTGAVKSDIAQSTFETGDVNASDNKITIEVVQANADRVECKTTTTNSDPYVIITAKKTDCEGKSDTEIMKGMFEYDLEQYFREGNWHGSLIGLEQNTDYYLLAFGASNGAPTTSLTKVEFKTTEAGDPSKLIVSYDIDIKSYREVNITATGEPYNAGFYWEAVNPARTSPEEWLDYLTELADHFNPGDRYGFFQQQITRGTSLKKYDYLWGETEHVIYAVGIEDGTGDFATEVKISEPFTTMPREVRNVSIEPVFGNYFDARELAERYPEYFGNEPEKYDGNVAIDLLNVEISNLDECPVIEIGMLNGDYTNQDKYIDEEVVDLLMMQRIFVFITDPTIPAYRTILLAKYDSDYTFAGFGGDVKYYGEVYRKMFNISKSDISPAEDYNPFWGRGQKISDMTETYQQSKHETYHAHKPIKIQQPISGNSLPEIEVNLKASEPQLSNRNIELSAIKINTKTDKRDITEEITFQFETEEQ